MPEDPPTILDVPQLLENSLPRQRPAWIWYALIGFAVALLTSTLASGQNQALQMYVRALGGLAMLGVVIAMGIFTSHTVRQQRKEQQRVEAIEELVQLRRWDQAAAMLDAMLSEPTRMAGSRLQALIYLAGVLARYHRFADAIAVQNYLLEHAQFDPGTTHGIKLMRTMAMLHEDQLFDADRAISELRREAPDSAGLTLIEIYRDVKTGHPEEAIELFNARTAILRAQLGHRISDAFALIARARDLLGQDTQAAEAFDKATLLVPADELYRRYPEVAALRGKYPAAAMPSEGA
jgi:thioredoxin-like negative regulator of GroEL